MLVAEASQGWRGDVSRDVTIQIKPRPGDDIDADVAKAADVAARAPGVADARAYTKAESEKLLAPWLGDGLDLGQLPIPRLIVVHMRRGHREDLEPLRAALAAGAPDASLDDHRLWLSRLDAMADAIVVFAAALVRADDRRDGDGDRLRHARRDGGQSRDHRGAAFRRRRRRLHRPAVPEPFPAARPAGRGDRRRRGGAVLRRGGAALGLARRSAGGEEIAALFGAFALGLSATPRFSPFASRSPRSLAFCRARSSSAN